MQTATETQPAASRTLRREDVIRVYSGRSGCACGCRGNYYATAAAVAADPRVAATASVSEARVTRILGQIEQDADAAWHEGFDDERIIFVDTGKHLTMVFVRSSADLSAYPVSS